MKSFRKNKKKPMTLPISLVSFGKEEGTGEVWIGTASGQGEEVGSVSENEDEDTEDNCAEPESSLAVCCGLVVVVVSVVVSVGVTNISEGEEEFECNGVVVAEWIVGDCWGVDTDGDIILVGVRGACVGTVVVEVFVVDVDGGTVAFGDRDVWIVVVVAVEFVVEIEGDIIFFEEVEDV